MYKIVFFLCVLSFSITGFAKVYDCFMFSNELEVLEIRLNELDSYVDYFVLVEWNRAHRKGNLKPLYFEENKEKFARFLPKIIHIKLDEVIETDNGWVRENWHRNQVMRGLTDCKPNDIIIISDVDEIIPGKIVPRLGGALNEYGRLGFWQKLYRWFLNRESGQMIVGPCVIRHKDLLNTTPQDLRNAIRRIPDAPRWCAGWHFSSMGGYEKTKEKYYNIVEGYDKWYTEEKWYKHVQKDTALVPIDRSYPRFVRQNIDYLIETNLVDPHDE